MTKLTTSYGAEICIPAEVRQAVLDELCARRGGHDYELIFTAEGPTNVKCELCERWWRVVLDEGTGL